MTTKPPSGELEACVHLEGLRDGTYRLKVFGKSAGTFETYAFGMSQVKDIRTSLNAWASEREKGLVEALKYFADPKKWGWDGEKRATFDAYKLDGLDVARKALEGTR